MISLFKQINVSTSGNFQSGVFVNGQPVVTSGQTGTFTGLFYPLHANPTGYSILPSLVNISGRLGLNITNPQAALDITGNYTGNNYFLIQAVSDQGTWFRIGTNFGIDNQIYANNTTFIDGETSIILNGHQSAPFVGVGTLTPVYTLDVSGSGRFTSELNVTGYRVLTTADSGLFNTGISTGALTGVFYPLSSNPAGYMASQEGVYDTAGNFFNTSVTNNEVLDLDNQNLWWSHGDDNGICANWSSAQLYDLSNPRGGAGNLTLDWNALSLTGDWTLNGNAISTGGGNGTGYPDIYDVSGNVGINNPNPQTTLDVFGNASINGYITFGYGQVGLNSNFIGLYAGENATSATYSNFIGYQAGLNATSGNFSTFIGLNAGETAVSANNSIFIGQAAGKNATNANNSIFMGQFAGGYTFGGGATNASGCIFLGYQAGFQATNSYKSTFIGWNAGAGSQNANNSIFIGNNAGFFDTVNNSTIGNFSILIGDNTSTNTYSNGICIGAHTYSWTNNHLNIGNILFGTNVYSATGIPFAAVSSGTIGILNPLPFYTLDVSGLIGNSAGSHSGSYINLSSDILVDGSGVSAVDWNNKFLSGNWKLNGLNISTASGVITSGNLESTLTGYGLDLNNKILSGTWNFNQINSNTNLVIGARYNLVFDGSAFGFGNNSPIYEMDINGIVGNSLGNNPASYIDLSNDLLVDNSGSNAVDWNNKILSGNWNVGTGTLSVQGHSVVTANQTGAFITTGQTGAFGSTYVPNAWGSLTGGSGTIVWNANTSVAEDKQKLTLTGNVTLSISGLYNGWAGLLQTVQSGSGFNLTLPAGTKVAYNGSGSISLTTGVSGAIDMVSFLYDGSHLFANVANYFS